MEGGTTNHLDVPPVDGIRSRAESGGSDIGGIRSRTRSAGRIGAGIRAPGDWDRQSTKFEAMIFAICLVDENSNKASARKFIEEIERTGIRFETDVRLAPCVSRLKKYRSRKNAPLESVNLDYDQFKHVIMGNLPLVTKIFRNDLVIPEFETFCQNVTSLYDKLKTNFDGEPASYIPQLARVPKEKWGISLVTVDGQRFSIGDVHDKFTVQSTSKPITYALSLEELGAGVVHKYQGREPSGRMFNEIVLDHDDQPHNPMVNSGAIMSASILLYLVKPEMDMAQKYDYVFDFFKKMAGGEYLGFNNSIFLSERDSADRNNALAYFMRENHCFPPGDIKINDVLDFYFQTCSLEMTCESASVIAATLANGGVCPTTDKRLVQAERIKHVLSLMLSCGLYNYSGEFAFKVGLPAKSGVSGTIMLVIPNVMGIEFYSPPLDEMGNSVRGVQFCEEFVHLYNFHKVAGDLGEESDLIDPTNNKYEVASQLIIHLLMAASAGDETALKGAYQQGVDMNLGDYDGRTALHLAAAEGHVRCVKFLLDTCGVKHDPKDRWGQTPLTEAIQFKHTKVAAMIKRTAKAREFKNKVGDQGLKDNDAIWRRIVERNLINPKDKKKKKKTPKGVGQYSDLSEDEDEDDEASGTEDGSRRESEELNGDKERENSGGRVMGEDEAARVIQAGFKNALKRRNTGSSLDTVVPNGNGNTAAAMNENGNGVVV